MASILVRQSVSRGNHRTFHDLELEVDEITFGSEPGNILNVSGPKVQPRHATISFRKIAKLRASGTGTFLHNGEEVKKAPLSVGDEFIIGVSKYTVIKPPLGFDFALIEHSRDANSGNIQESVYRTSIDDTPISVRWPSWVLSCLVIGFCFIIPFITTQYFGGRDTADDEPSEEVVADDTSAEIVAEKKKGPIHTAAWISDNLWTTGSLHPAHRLAIGDDCSACHTELFDRVADSACKNCHESVTSHAMEAAFTEVGQKEASCRTCHAEHEGSEVLIDASGSDCAMCHSSGSLTKGHAEFTNFPNPARPQIIFDHTGHWQEHFSKTDKEFVCSSCHTLEPGGGHQTTGSFENMCVDCHSGNDSASGPDSKLFHHGDQISSSDPIALFNLPAVDLRSLGDDPNIGVWPESTRKGNRKGITRLGLPPMAEFLLMLDEDAAPALSRLKASKLQLRKLRRAKEAQLQDMYTVLWGLRRLMLDLSENPDAALFSRISPLLQQPLTIRQTAALSGQLSPDFIRSIATVWYAETGFESFEKAATQSMPEPFISREHMDALPMDEGRIPGVEWVLTGSWTENKYSIEYLPSGHRDEFIRQWVDVSSELVSVLPEGNGKEFTLRTAAEEVLDSFADIHASGGDAKGAGRCTKCHSRNIDDDGILRFAWHSTQHPPMLREYTWYSHAPHIGKGANETCVMCHQLDKDTDVLASYDEDAEPSAFISNFSPVTQEVCGTCHGDNLQASDQCITCHNYHVSPTMIEKHQQAQQIEAVFNTIQ